MRIETRRNAARRLADRHVRLTHCFSRAATGAVSWSFEPSQAQRVISGLILAQLVSWCFEPSQAQRVISGLILAQKKKSVPIVSRGLGRTLPLTVPLSGFPLAVVKMTGQN